MASRTGKQQEITCVAVVDSLRLYGSLPRVHLLQQLRLPTPPQEQQPTDTRAQNTHPLSLSLHDSFSRVLKTNQPLTPQPSSCKSFSLSLCSTFLFLFYFISFLLLKTSFAPFDCSDFPSGCLNLAKLSDWKHEPRPAVIHFFCIILFSTPSYIKRVFRAIPNTSITKAF